MAGPTRAGGYTSHASDSVSKFIPQVWSGKLVEKFYAATVFGEIANTDYEGEISDVGDSVVIRTVPDVTISDYEIGGGLTYENLNSTAELLDIDRAKSFAFAVNDIDKYQSDIAELNKWSDETGNKLKIACDTEVLGSIYSDAAASNAGLTAGAISGNIDLGAVGGTNELSVTAANVIDVITQYGQVLDENNVPEQGRWLVVPAWFTQRIKTSDLKDASLAGDGTSILRNGRVGMVDRFTLYMSNLLTREVAAPNGFHIMFGHSAGLTFASQMVKMESLPNPDDFGELIRGLNVFGFEVINDTAIGHSVAVPG